MRFKGTLIDWKDDRGFGFIEPAEGGARIFCHVKAFEVRVRRPIAGDKVTYEVGKDARGRITAMKVSPVGFEGAQYQSNTGSHRNSKAPQSSALRNKSISIFLIAIIASAGWRYFHNESSSRVTTEAQQPDSTALMSNSESDSTPSPTFQCDGRVYCTDMRSRAEAEFFIKHCPGTKMDGDNDGEPCESDSRF